MASALLVFLPLLAVAVTAAAVLVAVPRRRALVALDRRAFPGLARLQRTTIASRLVAMALGLVVVVPVVDAGHLGRGLALAPAAFAAVQVLGVLAGDLASRQAARTPGSAGIEVRRVRDFLPARLTLWAILTAVALGALLAWTTLVGDPDDLGRAGRSVSYRCVQDCTTGSLGPWPGSYYSVPMAIGLVALLVLGVLAVAASVRRPRNGADREVVRVDDAVRRRCVESVVAAVGVALSASTTGVGLLAGLDLAGQTRAPFDLRVGGLVAAATGLASLVFLTWCLVVLVLPGARAPRGRDTDPAAGTPGSAALGASPAHGSRPGTPC